MVGSAFALYILFGLPLWIGVLVTGFDTLLFLLIQKLGVRYASQLLIDLGINTFNRYLEYFITLLIAIISGCFVVEMFMTAPPVTEVLEGFIPTIPDGSVYTGISLMVCARDIFRLTRVRPRFMNIRVEFSNHTDHATGYFIRSRY